MKDVGDIEKHMIDLLKSIEKKAITEKTAQKLIEKLIEKTSRNYNAEIDPEEIISIEDLTDLICERGITDSKLLEIMDDEQEQILNSCN